MKTSEANLSDAHRSVIDHLIHEAKVLDEKIRNDKGLKQAIFTELQLRQMAIQLPDSLDDLLALRGVNKAKVVAHGARFLPLIRRYQQTINDMMGNSNDRDIDANHRIVVDLMSDEPDEPEETDYSEEEKLQESSAYFSHPPQTQAFNEELRNAMGASQSQAYEGEEHFSIPKRTTGTGRGGGFKGKGRGGFGSKKNYPKRNSGGSASTSASRVSKKRVSTSSRRTASGSGTTSARASTSRPQPLPLEASSGPARTMQNFVKRGGNGGGFAAMPTN
jgi:bloom syndrome protein